MNTVDDYIKDGWFPFLREGLFEDSKGRWHAFPEGKLKQIEAVNADIKEIPFCEGHPLDNKPEKGNTDKIEKVGNFLLARPKKITDDMVQKLKNGVYKFVSASINPQTFRINHIGFVDDPAIKGLGQFPATAYANFSTPEGEDEILLSFEYSQFSEQKKEKEKPALELLARLISKLGLWDHELKEIKFVDEYSSAPVGPPGTTQKSESINDENKPGEQDPGKEEQKLKKIEKGKKPPGNEPDGNGVEVEESVDFQAQIAAERKRADKEKNRADALQSRLTEIEEKKKEDDAAEFAAKLQSGNLIYPKRKGEVQALFMVLTDVEPIEFSGKKEQLVVDVIPILLKEAQNPVPLDPLKDQADKEIDDDEIEFSAENVPEEDRELHRKAKAIAKEKNISYEEALKKARR